MDLEEISNLWLNSGIKKGDSLLLHSNLSRWSRILIKSKIKNPIELIFNSFLKAIGDEGTLILPLFNFDFNNGVTFDIRYTPSHMGSLTEYARCRSDAYRSGHPVYSFCAIGKYASKFENIVNKSAYSNQSPFQLLRDLDGSVAVLDLEDQASMTFFHHVEELCKVNYRYLTHSHGNYVDKNGNKSYRSFQIFVRDLERGIKTHVNPMGEILWDKNIYRGDRPKVNSGLRIGNANDIFNATEEIIKSEKSENVLFKKVSP